MEKVSNGAAASKAKLVEPRWVAEGARVYVCAGTTDDGLSYRWRPARVVVAAGDAAKVVTHGADNETVFAWRSLVSLRVLEGSKYSASPSPGAAS